MRIIRKNKPSKIFTKLFLLLTLTFSVLSCDFEYDLPEEGSIADLTPPLADFNFAVSGTDYLTYKFTNLSRSATDYVWNFGDGSVATTKDATHSYTDEGTYSVSLEVSDKLGATSTISYEVLVEAPPVPEAIVPVISEAGFEDGTDIKGCGTAADGRDCWRIAGGTVFGITSSPVHSGSQGAKFDKGSNRVAYQTLEVSKNTDYVVSMFYTIKNDVLGSQMRLAILGHAIGDASEAEAAIIASLLGGDQTDPNTYVELKLAFNTGDSDVIAIWIDSNNIAESRVDDVSIALAED